MKNVLGVMAVALCVSLGVYLFVSKPEEPAASLPVIPDPPSFTLKDPAAVFHKAFARHPAADDRILHAERREWSDAAGVKKWQWFIVVDPSPQLVKFLREDNAFSLAPARSVPQFANAPAWFVFEPGEVEILHAPQGSMSLCFSKTTGRLFATDHGFRPGATGVSGSTSGKAPVERTPEAKIPADR